MIPTHVIPFKDGELRIGWASWDRGRFTERSIKWAYKDTSGKISRGSPELPFDVLAAMVDLALEQEEVPAIPTRQQPTDVKTLSKQELLDERQALSVRLMSLQNMVRELPWVDIQKVYDQIGMRYDDVKTELASRL